jgi:Na+:H+ antiporter, NhaA family
MTRAIRYILEHSITVPLGAMLALVWANVASESYFRFAIGQAWWINNVGMALFFGFALQEVIETMEPGGALESWRRAVLPVVAAVGGALGAVAGYEAWVFRSQQFILSMGWPIACGVDAAFAYFVVKNVTRQKGAAVFLLLLAIAGNAISLIVISLRDPIMEPLHAGVLAGVILILVAIIACYAMSKMHVHGFWPYLLVGGPIAWFGFAWSGLHPALALLPIVPFFRHTPIRDLDELFEDAPHGAHDSPTHFEHVFRIPVQIVLFLFALVNAGVLATNYGTGSWAVLIGALIGRPLGVIVSVWLACLAGLRLPARVGWPMLIVIACASSIGFVFALFYATATVPVGPVLGELKTGALLTAGGAGLAIGVARLLRVGRFA